MPPLTPHSNTGFGKLPPISKGSMLGVQKSEADDEDESMLDRADGPLSEYGGKSGKTVVFEENYSTMGKSAKTQILPPSY